MKLLEQLTGEITGVAKDGSGEIVRPEGKPIHVYNVIPGETVAATPVKRFKDAIRARLDEVRVPSAHRVAPRCPYAGTCGGCKWQHIDYEHQRSLKLRLITESFMKAQIPCPVETIQGAPEAFYYRNRMDYVFGPKGELGLKEPERWWSILDLKTCFLLSPESVEVMSKVREWARATGLPFWDGKTHKGFFRYLVIREGKNTGERMVTIVTGDPTEGLRQAQAIPAIFPELVEGLDRLATSVLWGVNPLLTDLSISQTVTPIKGDPWIFEKVNNISYKITPNAFFQTNTTMAAQLQDAVVRLCGNLAGKTLLDLYCGSGFFSLALADQAKRTIGIELDAEAIACAKENAQRNNKTADYFVSKAEDFDWASESPDVVILDPPRSGLHPRVLETITTALPPTIVYVSCNYQKFAEECATLLKHYKITNAVALDLFPHTPHLELVVRLEKR